MYVAPHLQAKLDPGVVGFRSHREMWDLQADRLDLPMSARRFEFSTMAYGSAVGLARSIDYLLGIGIQRVFNYNQYLTDLLIDGLSRRGAEIISPQREPERTAIVAARFANRSATRIANQLKAKKVAASTRRGMLRFSPHLYNQPADIERALEELRRLL